MLENSQGRTRPDNNTPVFRDPNSREFTGGTLKCFMDCSLRNIGTVVDIVDDPIHKLIEELLATDNPGPTAARQGSPHSVLHPARVGCPARRTRPRHRLLAETLELIPLFDLQICVHEKGGSRAGADLHREGSPLPQSRQQ